MGKENDITFEEALKQLEKIVKKLEEEDVSLENMIHYYKRGMELSNICNTMLKDAEEQMTEVLNEDGKTEPFENGEDI